MRLCVPRFPVINPSPIVSCLPKLHCEYGLYLNVAVSGKINLQEFVNHARLKVMLHDKLIRPERSMNNDNNVVFQQVTHFEVGNSDSFLVVVVPGGQVVRWVLYHVRFDIYQRSYFLLYANIANVQFFAKRTVFECLRGTLLSPHLIQNTNLGYDLSAPSTIALEVISRLKHFKHGRKVWIGKTGDLYGLMHDLSGHRPQD